MALLRRALLGLGLAAFACGDNEEAACADSPAGDSCAKDASPEEADLVSQLQVHRADISGGPSGSSQKKDPCAKTPNPAYGVFEDPCCQNLKGPGCTGQLPVGCAAGGLPQVCRYCFLPGSYLDDGSLPVCPESVKKKDVLLIIDMLKDYSVAYNKRTYGFLRNPFLDESAPPIEDAMKEQVKVVKSKTKHWDTIVFTQDWLIPSIIASIGFPGAEIENHSFCIRDTPGAEPFDALTAAASQRKAKQIRFKKNRNNVFTTDVPNPDIGAEYQKKAKEDPDMYPSVPEDYPNRGFDVDDAFSNSTFQEMLDDLGHTAEAVKLTVVGTIADMCVLTSTVNALYHGYEVQVYVPGLNGGAEEAEPGWAACVHGQPGSGACCVPLPEEIARSPKSHQGWQERVYACQSAAGYKNALEYMRLAGAELLWTVP